MSDYHRYDDYHPYNRHNPSTGLPMRGSVDIAGYMFGESPSDRFTAPTSSFSSYNPMHQGTGSGFGNAINSGVENDISSSHSKIIQIAFATFVGTVTTAGFVAIVLGFAGVF